MTEIRRKLPLALVACLERMMAKPPGDRFASVHDAALALEPLCHGADLCLLSGGSFNPLRPCRRRKERHGLIGGLGEIAERCSAVLGWTIRGVFATRSSAAPAPQRQPMFSLGGLALLVFVGFVLSQTVSCEPIDGPAALPGGAGDVQVLEFGFGPLPPASLPAPNQR